MDVVVALHCVCSVCAHVCLCVWGLGTHATQLRSERSEDVMAGEAGSLGGKAASLLETAWPRKPLRFL